MWVAGCAQLLFLCVWLSQNWHAKDCWSLVHGWSVTASMSGWVCTTQLSTHQPSCFIQRLAHINSFIDSYNCSGKHFKTTTNTTIKVYTCIQNETNDSSQCVLLQIGGWTHLYIIRSSVRNSPPTTCKKNHTHTHRACITHSNNNSVHTTRNQSDSGLLCYRRVQHQKWIQGFMEKSTYSLATQWNLSFITCNTNIQWPLTPWFAQWTKERPRPRFLG